MNGVTEADRKAAAELRELLADMCGFWFNPSDNGPLCAALARHREACELQLLEKLRHSTVRVGMSEVPLDIAPARPRAMAVNG